jgi:hypothetical protein
MRGGDRRGADGRDGPAALRRVGGTTPSKSKSRKIRGSKIASFCSLLFFRIGTFQWVTAEKIKKIPLSFLLVRGVEQAPVRSGRLSEVQHRILISASSCTIFCASFASGSSVTSGRSLKANLWRHLDDPLPTAGAGAVKTRFPKNRRRTVP